MLTDGSRGHSRWWGRYGRFHEEDEEGHHGVEQQDLLLSIIWKEKRREYESKHTKQDGSISYKIVPQYGGGFVLDKDVSISAKNYCKIKLGLLLMGPTYTRVQDSFYKIYPK